MTTWHYRKGQELFGPVDEEMLIHLSREGVITGNTFLLKEGWREWRTAYATELRDYLHPPAAATGPLPVQAPHAQPAYHQPHYGMHTAPPHHPQSPPTGSPHHPPPTYAQHPPPQAKYGGHPQPMQPTQPYPQPGVHSPTQGMPVVHITNVQQSVQNNAQIAPQTSGNPWLGLLNLFFPYFVGVSQGVQGQPGKGLLIWFLFWSFIWTGWVSGIIWMVAVVDGFMVGAAQKGGKPVAKWQFFP